MSLRKINCTNIIVQSAEKCNTKYMGNMVLYGAKNDGSYTVILYAIHFRGRNNISRYAHIYSALFRYICTATGGTMFRMT